MKQPVLSLRNLRVSFAGTPQKVPVLHGISLDLFENEVLCLVGESGSGKSVTALAVAGLLPPNAEVTGEALLDGQNTLALPEYALARLRGLKIGFIFQDPSTTLNPVLPVGAQITEGQVWHGALEAQKAPARAVELLKEVEIASPERRARQYPHQFSGGMRQRAVIGMAMAGQPRIILADEPTTALDVTVQAQILALLARRQRETRAPLLLITHDLGVVAEVADRVAVMYGGRIVEIGPVAEIFARPQHPYTAALIAASPRLDQAERALVPIPGPPVTPTTRPKGCAFAPRCSLARGREICTAEDPPLRPLAPNRAAACHFAEDTNVPTVPARAVAAVGDAPNLDTAPLLALRDLKVHYTLGTRFLGPPTVVKAVDGLSLSLNEGETFSLVGESGCGKSTTAKAIMGLTPATSGEITFQGQNLLPLRRGAARAARQAMQYVFQDPFSSLNPVKTVEDIVAEPLLVHGRFQEMGGKDYIAQLFERVGLSPAMFGRYPAEFSGGQKQRIGIARALALKPRLLLLDEPVAALDVSIQAQILNLLAELQETLGLSYLFIAHNLSVVRHISDRVGVMYMGRLVELAPRDQLYNAPLHPYTRSLLAAVPIPDPSQRGRTARMLMQGELPDPLNPPKGCLFAPRCAFATELCHTAPPPLRAHAGSEVACHYAGEI